MYQESQGQPHDQLVDESDHLHRDQREQPAGEASGPALPLEAEKDGSGQDLDPEHDVEHAVSQPCERVVADDGWRLTIEKEVEEERWDDAAPRSEEHTAQLQSL